MPSSSRLGARPRCSMTRAYSSGLRPCWAMTAALWLMCSCLLPASGAVFNRRRRGRVFHLEVIFERDAADAATKELPQGAAVLGRGDVAFEHEPRADVLRREALLDAVLNRLELGLQHLLLEGE